MVFLYPKMNTRQNYFYLLFIVVIFSCTAPRTINVSGKTTPKGEVVAGASYNANLAGGTALLAKDIITQNIDDLKNKDTLRFDPSLERINKALVAYAVDPVSAGFDFYIRAGITERLEAGYKLAGKAHSLYAQYQFLGTTEKTGQKSDNPDKISQQFPGLYGSVGLQFAWQGYSLPGSLGDAQGLLGYSFKRRDILVPFIFSYSFGPGEKYGSLAFGAAYGYSFLKYSSLPTKIVIENNRPVTGKTNRSGYSSFGFFMNVKLGYKYIYAIPALSVFYQDYGDYELLNGKTFGFHGFTFVPSMSLQVRLGRE